MDNDTLMKILKGMSPVSVLDAMAPVQPMSDEAFVAYKELASDKTWSYGKCKIIMRNGDEEANQDRQAGGSENEG